MAEENRVAKEILARSFKEPISSIVLFGGSNCGKTCTLQHLAVLLCGGGHLNRAIQSAFESVFYDSKRDYYRDADIIVHYCTEDKKSISIYVSTDGDSWPIVEDNFRFFYHCIRSRHKVYEFNGTNFNLCDEDELELIEKPQICITPANYTKYGGIQAAHYYHDITCEDWNRNIWIRKKPCTDPGPAVPGYTKPRRPIIRERDDIVANRLVELINQMLSETII